MLVLTLCNNFNRMILIFNVAFLIKRLYFFFAYLFFSFFLLLSVFIYFSHVYKLCMLLLLCILSQLFVIL